MTTTEMTKVDTNVIAQIDEIVGECGLIVSAQEEGAMAMFRMAEGIGALKRLFTPAMMKPLMDLQGSALGFRTDKDKEGGYPPEIVKDCLIEGLLKGARPIGNEINIIAARCYLTKEYFVRMLRVLDGMENLVIEFGVPTMKDGGALVTAKGWWVYRDKPGSMVCDVVRDAEGRVVADNRIPIRVNAGMGTDAILGKAERKFRARILSRLTNTTWGDGDADDVIEGKFIESAPAQVNNSVKDRIQRNKTASESAPEVSEILSDQVIEETIDDSVEVGTEKEKPSSFRFEPDHDEVVKDYHPRLMKLIDEVGEMESLMIITDIIGRLLESKYLNTFRHNAMTAKINARATALEAG